MADSSPAFLSPEAEKSWRPFLPSAIVVGLGVVLTALVAWRVAVHARELDQNRFHRLVRQSAAALHDRLEKYELALQGVADYIAARPTLAPAEWRFRIRLLWPEQKYPGLLEIGFAETTFADMPEGHPEAPSDKPAPSASFTRTIPLRLRYSWVLPPSAADGIRADFLEEPVMVAAVRTALHSGQTAFAFPSFLSAEVGGNPATGFTLVVRVFEPGLALPRPGPGGGATDEAAHRTRERTARGVVFGSIVGGMLVENLFGTAPREVDFDLFSTPEPSEASWLNARGDRPLSLQPGFNPYLRTNFTLHLPAYSLGVVFHTTPLFEQESPRRRAYMVVGVGLTLTALVGALLFNQIRARLRQESIAAELRAACADLQQVQNERERIGRDLHDGAIQSLYGLQLTLSHFEHLLGRNPEAARALLARCRNAIDALIQELRTFIVQHVPGDDKPERVAQSGAALQQLVHRFQSASSVPIELVLKDSPPTLVTLGQQIHLRQIAQEAISNSLRHGRPRHIRVELHRQAQHLRLRVADDGVGFDAEKSAGGQGLANMQARAVQLGGHLHVKSRPGQGTEVILEMPVPD